MYIWDTLKVYYSRQYKRRKIVQNKQDRFEVQPTNRNYRIQLLKYNTLPLTLKILALIE